ncbi:MAG: sugar transferase [Tenericutes bacterium]|nr:sugar transferase [Mycoplasmatota bacterium]
MYEKYLKRPFDFIVALIAFMMLSPLLLLTAIMVRVKLGLPVVFKQERPGLNEKTFKLYKFRTMTDKRDDYGELLPDAMRLTKFGKFLRSTSLDELPSLINIIKGDMSLVGPRPLLIEYLSLYSTKHKKRHLVKPGLSGLAQINGRNSISWEEKLDYDIEYIKDISFLLDAKIIIKTLFKVIQRKDITSNNSETTELFRGNYKNK